MPALPHFAVLFHFTPAPSSQIFENNNNKEKIKLNQIKSETINKSYRRDLRKPSVLKYAAEEGSQWRQWPLGCASSTNATGP